MAQIDNNPRASRTYPPLTLTTHPPPHNWPAPAESNTGGLYAPSPVAASFLPRSPCAGDVASSPQIEKKSGAAVA